MAGHLDSWLDGIGLSMYAGIFAEHRVDLEVLPELTDDDLRGLGIPLGHRKRLLKAIAALPERGVRDESRPSASTQQPGERRQLTIMFCDLVDSTALSARLDPEDLRDVMLAYQRACAGVIGEYGGHVAKYLGDGVLAYFGYPRAHEDDAERAARAALAVVASIARGGLSRIDAATDLAVRIGIDTGVVVVGDVIGEGAAREVAVVGETPNIAARLQALAQPGQIVVGPLTHALIGDAFAFDDLGEQPLKGVSRPIRAFALAGERGAGAHEPPREEAPLVGRREEFALLCRAFDAAKRGTGSAVLVRGEPGIGKSRLVAELLAHCANDECDVVVTACSPFHVNATLHPVVERLKEAMAWRGSDDSEARLARLEAHLRARNLPLAHCVPLYADLLALTLPGDRYARLASSAQERREQLLDALAADLVADAEHKPVVNVWEDLQWADATTLQLLGHCIDEAPTVRMLNVLTCRAEFTPPWPARSHVAQITLNRLEGPDVQALVMQRTAGRELPGEVVDYVLDKTDGVPLYVEEMTKALLETDFLHEENGVYTIARPLSDATIPPTLHDLLMARLDRLPTIREVAQLGSVLGREFAYEMVQAIGVLAPSALHSGLDQLVDCELLYQRGRRPRAKYIFRHALIHDAAYQSLLKRTRQYYHRQVAQMLEARYPEIVRTQPELVAYHYSRADEHEKALGYFVACADRAAAMYAHANAIVALRQARAHAGQLPGDVRDRIVLGLVIREAELLHFTGAREAIVALLLDHRERLEALCSPLLAAEFHFWLGFAHSWLGHRDDAQKTLAEGLREASDAGDVRVVGRVHRALATECFYSGRPLDEAIGHARAAVSLLTDADDRFWLSQALFTLSYCCMFAGDFDEAERAARALSAFADANGAGRSQANAAMLEGLCHATRGDGDAGIARCEQALAVSPDRFETAFILACLGKSCLEAGNFARAVTVLDEAVALAEEVRSLQFREWFRTMLAEACLRAGDVVRAEALANAAGRTSASVGFVIGVGLAEQIRATIALAAGDVAAATLRVEAAVTALRASGAKFELARTRLAEAAVADRRGDANGAAAALGEARTAFAALDCPRYSIRAGELARDLGYIVQPPDTSMTAPLM